MTVAELLALSADRTTDALVALANGLEVLGLADASNVDGSWCIHDFTGQLNEPVFVSHCTCNESMEWAKHWRQSYEEKLAFKNRLGHWSYCCEVVPHYTTDLNDAGKLTVPNLRLYIHSPFAESIPWHACWRSPFQRASEGGLIVKAATEAHAQALAFLAVKTEINE